MKGIAVLSTGLSWYWSSMRYGQERLEELVFTVFHVGKDSLITAPLHHHCKSSGLLEDWNLWLIIALVSEELPRRKLRECENGDKASLKN